MPASSRRTTRGSLSRTAIVDAALATVRSGGGEQLSIRSLAGDLGVTPMALYRHVTDKDDLLDEVVDRLLADRWQPTDAGDDWAEWVAEASDRFRRFLVEEPAALQVYLSHPVIAPTALHRRSAMLATLRDAGATADEADRAFAAVHTYTIGFAALQAGRAGWSPPPGGDPVAGELAGYASPAQFAQGLVYLLEGITRHTAAGDDPPSRVCPPSDRPPDADG